MIKITITPPKKESYSVEFTTVSDAIDYLLTLHTYGYEGACEAAQQELPRGRKATSAQEEVDRLGERLAENHAKLQSASRQ